MPEKVNAPAVSQLAGEIACCAHLNVLYVRINHDNGTCSDSWECRDCHTPFKPFVRKPISASHSAFNCAACGTDTCRLPNAPVSAALSERESKVQALVEMTTILLDVMETCHVCQGALLLQDFPVHCEDCSADCEDHEGEECVPIFQLHRKVREALSALGGGDMKTEHALNLTAGQVNKVTGEVEKPWRCKRCGKYFSRHTRAKTCKGVA